VSIARFYDPLKDVGAYVLWAPTSVGTVSKGFALDVSSTLTQATLVTLVDKSTTGQELALAPKRGTLTLDVSETPSIVLVTGKP
jgi:hypothetical protein